MPRDRQLLGFALTTLLLGAALLAMAIHGLSQPRVSFPAFAETFCDVRPPVKLRKDSFAARLSSAQRDELFTALAGGLGLEEAAKKVHAWTKPEWGGKPPSTQAVSAWFTAAKVERRYSAAKEVALVAQANCPADFDEQARRALGQARFLATLEDLSPKEVAVLEKNELTREKLALEKQRLALDVRVQRLSLSLDRAKILLERSRGGETGGDLQQQIDLALDEIEKLKHGEAA